MDLKKLSEEVFVATATIVQIGPEQILFLKEQARISPRKRARICAHSTNEDALHEMLIAISADSYIHPHKHLGKSESFHIVEGEVDVVLMDDGGEVTDVIELGDVPSHRKFYYRLAESAFHTLLIRTDFLVVHEVTNGPFDKARTVLASFAPDEGDTAATAQYMTQTASRAMRFKAIRG